MVEMKEKILRIISDKTDTPISEITNEKTLRDLGADSLDAVELIMEIEDKLWVKFADQEMNDLKTVGDIIELASKKKILAN